MSDTQFAVVDKLLEWPIEYVAPGLNYLRMLVRHPFAATYYAKKLEEKDPRTDVIAKSLKVATEAVKPAHADLALRVLSNMFSRRALFKILGARYEEILDKIASLGGHADVKVRLSYLGLLVNFSILFREDPKQFAEAKVHCLSSLMELLSLESDPTAVYQALVVLGTLVYRDNNCKEMASGLEVEAAVQKQAQAFSGNARVSQCAAEVLQALQPDAQ